MNSYFSKYQIQFTLLVSDITSLLHASSTVAVELRCVPFSKWYYYWNLEHSLLQLWNKLVLLYTFDVCYVIWDHLPLNHSPDIARKTLINSILNIWLANWQVYLDSRGGSGYTQPQSSLEFIKSVNIFSHIVGPQGCSCTPANTTQKINNK
jgi:hypothetical protein